MLKTSGSLRAALVAAALAAFLAHGGAAAQQKAKGGGKIVCWKDQSGKVIGCGDTVPPEYQEHGTKELDRTGVTRRVTETAQERARREALEKEQAERRAEEKKRIAEQRRQDTALLSTFSNEQEIDLKRDRDLQVLENQLGQLRAAHKNATARQADFSARIKSADKAKGASEYHKEELARAESEKARLEAAMAGKEKERDDINKRYAEMKERYLVLKGGAPAATAAHSKK